MDILLYVLLSIIFTYVFTKIISILNNYITHNNKNKINTRRNLYIFLIIIILIVCLYEIYNQPINNFQVGGDKDTKNKNKINKMKALCNFNTNDSETQHCFSDLTHHTCCMLGPKAREYADKTGNTIGSASERSYKRKYNKKPNNLTSWCTCTGSSVCSFYANKFNDGTHIKFINDPNSKDKIYENVSPKCEKKIRDKLDIYTHGTPGILNNNKKINKKDKCKYKNKKI